MATKTRKTKKAAPASSKPGAGKRGTGKSKAASSKKAGSATRKKKKSAAPARSKSAISTRVKAESAHTEAVEDPIEKKMRERLLRIEERIAKRKQGARKTLKENAVEPADEPEDVSMDSGQEGSPTGSEDEEYDVNIKKLKRRRAASRSSARGRARRSDSVGMPDEEGEDRDDDALGYDSEEADNGSLAGMVEKLLNFMPGSREEEYEGLIDRLEHMDEFGKNPDLDARLEAFVTFLYEKYWRVETSGLENVPDEGRALIVANHSGVLPFDGAMMATAIFKFHPAGRYARFLIEDWFGQLPFATEFMNAVGQVRACQENAERLLRQDQLVGVFPEGMKGMAKGFKDRYNLARFGRGGVIRLAIRTGSPVVPCAVVGAEEIYVVLGYANWLGKMFGMPLLPITATFPWLGPFGFIPMPTKWHIQFGEVIRYDEYDESALKDNVIINRLNRQLRATVQEMVDSMLKKRRSLFF